MRTPTIEAYPADHSGWDRLAAAVAEARRDLNTPYLGRRRWLGIAVQHGRSNAARMPIGGQS